MVGRDPFATFLGIKVEEVRKAYSRVAVTVKPEFMNAVERAHGAFIHALADQAFAVACNSTGVMAIAVNFKINYLSSADDGEKIFAEATPGQYRPQGQRVEHPGAGRRGQADRNRHRDRLPQVKDRREEINC